MRCYDADHTQSCFYNSTSGCWEWSAPVACPEGCNGGVCGGVCTDECTPQGAAQCVNEQTIRECGYWDGQCLTWQARTCPADTPYCKDGACVECRNDGDCGVGVCQDGQCVTSCSDDDHDGYSCDDCDDTNEAIHPGAVEVCNNADDDCDGVVDEGCDDDRDGFADASMSCDGSFLDGTGVVRSCSLRDCDDTNPEVYPGAGEYCNGVDDDCDGVVDDTPMSYVDRDHDGYGDQPVDGCFCDARGCPDGFASQGGDCDDTNPAASPAAREVCTDGVDNNCDGLLDGADSDCARIPCGADVCEAHDETVTTWSLLDNCTEEELLVTTHYTNPRCTMSGCSYDTSTSSQPSGRVRAAPDGVACALGYCAGGACLPACSTPVGCHETPPQGAVVRDDRACPVGACYDCPEGSFWNGEECEATTNTIEVSPVIAHAGTTIILTPVTKDWRGHVIPDVLYHYEGFRHAVTNQPYELITREDEVGAHELRITRGDGHRLMPCGRLGVPCGRTVPSPPTGAPAGSPSGEPLSHPGVAADPTGHREIREAPARRRLPRPAARRKVAP